jgi:serine protease
MTHRTLVRLFTSTLLAALAVGCSDDEPTAPSGPFLQVTSPGYFGLVEGSTKQLTATLDGQPVDVTWASSNTAVLTVSPTGLVTAVGAGNAAATATMTSDPTQIRSASFTITSPPTLTSGTAVTGISGTGARGTTRLYKIIVPTGATSLTVTLSGGTGDVDLFVQQGTPPTNTDFDCSSENAGNTEVCTITNPTPGTWYILLYLWDPYSGVTLKATVTP